MSEIKRVFSPDKFGRECAYGAKPTHWTIDDVKYCAYVLGTFERDPISAAKSYFEDVHYCADNGEEQYVDGEELLSPQPVSVTVYGLVQEGNRFFWTGTIQTVQFKTSVTVLAEQTSNENQT